jgi:hypothetical protein
MADMLPMPATEFCNPIRLVILMKSGYWLIHEIEQERGIERRQQ